MSDLDICYIIKMQVDFPLTSRLHSSEIDPSIAPKELTNKMMIQLNYFRSNYELWKRYIAGVEDKDPTNIVKYQLYKPKELFSKIWQIKYFKLDANLSDIAKIIEAKTTLFQPKSLYLFKYSLKSMTTISIFCEFLHPAYIVSDGLSLINSQYQISNPEWTPVYKLKTALTFSINDKLVEKKVHQCLISDGSANQFQEKQPEESIKTFTKSNSPADSKNCELEQSKRLQLHLELQNRIAFLEFQSKDLRQRVTNMEVLSKNLKQLVDNHDLLSKSKPSRRSKKIKKQVTHENSEIMKPEDSQE